MAAVLVLGSDRFDTAGLEVKDEISRIVNADKRGYNELWSADGNLGIYAAMSLDSVTTRVVYDLQGTVCTYRGWCQSEAVELYWKDTRVVSGYRDRDFRILSDFAKSHSTGGVVIIFHYSGGPSSYTTALAKEASRLGFTSLGVVETVGVTAYLGARGGVDKLAVRGWDGMSRYKW